MRVECVEYTRAEYASGMMRITARSEPPIIVGELETNSRLVSSEFRPRHPVPSRGNDTDGSRSNRFHLAFRTRLPNWRTINVFLTVVLSFAKPTRVIVSSLGYFCHDEARFFLPSVTLEIETAAYPKRVRLSLLLSRYDRSL